MDKNPFENKEQIAATFEIAKPEEWRDLAVILSEAAEKEPESFFPTQLPKKEDEANWRSYFEGNKFFVFAKIGSEIIGVGEANEGHNENNTPNGVWYINWAYVKSEFRRRGIGEKIYRERVKEIERRGGSKVLVSILKTNKGFGVVKDLNKKIGFREIQQDLHAESGSILMELTLNK